MRLRSDVFCLPAAAAVRGKPERFCLRLATDAGSRAPTPTVPRRLPRQPPTPECDANRLYCTNAGRVASDYSQSDCTSTILNHTSKEAASTANIIAQIKPAQTRNVNYTDNQQHICPKGSNAKTARLALLQRPVGLQRRVSGPAAEGEEVDVLLLAQVVVGC